MDSQKIETFLANTGNRTPDRPVPGPVAIQTTVLRQSLMASRKYSLTNIIRVIKINKNEMGGACNTRGEEERCRRVFVGEM